MAMKTILYVISGTVGDLNQRIRTRLMALVVVLVLPLTAVAQAGLHSNAVFTGAVVPKDNMVEVRVQGRAISKYGLTFYHSVRFTANAGVLGRVMRLVMEDARGAAGSERRDRGSEHSLILSMPGRGGQHRYLCFLYSGKRNARVTLVYMEGRVASIDELRKMIK